MMKFKLAPVAVIAAATLAAEKVAGLPSIRLRERVLNAMNGRGFKPDAETDLSVLAQMNETSKKSLDEARAKAPEKAAK